MKISSFKDAEKYLDSFIPLTNKWGEPSFAHNRTKHFMKLVGDPQNELKVIHVAGTSGKGSTCYITAALLHSQGLKVGMGISPHVLDVLERIQINQSSIKEEIFIKYLNEIVSCIEEMKRSQFGQPTYFEIIIGLSYYIFLKEKVDVVVMETGLGGQFCATNTITSENKISVITRIGYDHMEYLGNTLSLISNEKAKIIQKHNPTIKLFQEPEVMQVFEKEAAKKETELILIDPNTVIRSRKSNLSGLVFNFSYKDIQYENLYLSLIGEYQLENASIALAAFIEFMKRENRHIKESLLRLALKHINVPGRMEIKKYKGKELVIDGAHNSQKMEAFIKSLIQVFPDQKFCFLVSIKKGKDYETILQHIIPLASQIIVSSFENTNQGMGQLYSENPNTIAEILKKMTYADYQVVENLNKALDTAIKSSDQVVITGSLYLIGKIYNLLEK